MDGTGEQPGDNGQRQPARGEQSPSAVLLTKAVLSTAGHIGQFGTDLEPVGSGE